MVTPRSSRVGDLLDERTERTGMLRAGGRIPGEAPHVHLVDDPLGGFDVRGLHASPVEVGGVDHEALHRRVDVGTGGASAVVREVLAVDDRPGVGIDEHLLGIEAVALVGRIGAVYPVAVDRARPDPLHVDVPVVEGPVRAGVERGDLARYAVVVAVEDQQLDRGGRATEQREIHAIVRHRRADRVRLPRRDPVGPLHRSSCLAPRSAASFASNTRP